MEDEELNRILEILENPIRRRIIKRLSHGPNYPLQLAKELGLGQPLVAKHLAMMQKAGLVTSKMEKSPDGPKRRSYSLARSVSVTLDVAPNLFIQHGFSFVTVKERELTEDASALMADVSGISGDDEKAVASLSVILEKVDSKLDQLEEDRAALLYVRNLAMRTASEAISRVEDKNQRNVIFSVLEEHSREVEDLSTSLDLRETVVRKILDDIRSMLE